MRYSIALILMLLWGTGNAGDQSSVIDLAEENPKSTSSGRLEVTNDIDFKSITREEIEALHQIDLLEGSSKPTTLGRLEVTNDIDFKSMKIEAIMVLHQEARADPTGEKAFLLGRQYFISSLRFNSEFMNSDKKYAIKALELNADSIKMGYQKAEEYDELCFMGI